MWLWLSLVSAVLLGFYDVAKKQAIKRNGVLWILLGATFLSSLFLCPFLSAGPLKHHLALMLKAVLVTTSWVSGLIGLKLLPITTASTIKASRPVFVVAFSIILFGEKLNLWQWGGVLLVFLALWMLSRSSKKEGIAFKSNKGVAWMVLSVLSGSASALYDKHILGQLQIAPLFVQSWTNVYITVLLALLLLIKWLREKEAFEGFRWDWTIVLIGVLITISDACYFFALKDGDALLSVVSMIRRGAVVITFIAGALLFKEHNIRDKAVDLAVLLAGLALLLFGSSLG